MASKGCSCSSSAPEGQRHRILVADDGAFNRDVVRVLLERAGFEVDSVEDGAKALDAVRNAITPYHVVLMDLDMPVMNGFLAAEEIRRLGADLGAVPIVALTVLNEPREISHALASGIDGHIAKPFDPATFAASVQSCRDEADEARWRRQSAGDITVCPVWNRRTFDELSLYLQHSRLRDIVDLFEQQLEVARTVLDFKTSAAVAVANEAHNLVSAAGLFGFEQLWAASHHTQKVLMSCPEASQERIGQLRGSLLAALLRAQQVMRENVTCGTLFDHRGEFDLTA